MKGAAKRAGKPAAANAAPTAHEKLIAGADALLELKRAAKAANSILARHGDTPQWVDDYEEALKPLQAALEKWGEIDPTSNRGWRPFGAKANSGGRHLRLRSGA
jgi:hypothetical protein